MIALDNWAGNLRYGAARLHEPRSIHEVQQLVRSARAMRVLGSRHSFNDIADTTGDLVSLARLPRVFELDAARGTVTIDGAVTYGQCCRELEAAGFAFHNLASLPHISVAGACATGAHGSGDHSGSLATAVAAMEVVTADGELRRFERGRDGGFVGAAVSLGALGVVVKLTLDVQPTFRMRQDVFEDLPLTALVAHFEDITAAADSVSCFTRWQGPSIDMVWLKRRVAEGVALQPVSELYGAAAATVHRHPIRGLAAEACTPQLGVVGPWYERFPHFRLDHTPSVGAELQSEYFIPRTHAGDAVLALYRIGELIAPALQVSEIRTIAADELWMSPAFGRASVAFHFTWQPDWEGVRNVLPAIETALEPFEPRAHWGKLFTMPADVIRARYPRLPDFTDLVRRCDPGGTFRNAFLERTLL